MTFEEALEQCTPTKPIGNRVGDQEVVVKVGPEENRYSLQEGRPWIVEPARLIGGRLTREELRMRLPDVSFASRMDPNGWVVNPEQW